MKKRIMVLFFIISIITSSVCCASSARSCTAVFDASSNEVTIIGNSNGFTVIRIVPAQTSESELSHTNPPVVYKQLYSDGFFSWTVEMPESANAGKYTVYVTDTVGSSADSFVYINKSRAEGIIAELNKFKTSDSYDGFCDYLVKNASETGIDVNDEVYISNSSDIINILYKSEFSDSAEFSSKYNYIYVLCAFGFFDDTEGILNKYQSYLKIDIDSDYKSDSRLDSEAKTELMKIVREYDYISDILSNDGVAFEELFEQFKALAVLRTSQSWVAVKKCITDDFSDVFEGISVGTYYESVTDKDEVFLNMIEKGFTDFDSVFSVFRDSASEVYAVENERRPSSGGGGSSGGGFGGGGSGYFVPESKPADTVDPKIVSTSLFSDVDNDHWCYTALSTLADKKILNGFPDGTFRPDSFVTRAEFTKMIVDFAADIPSEGDMVFDDVSSDDWYAGCVSAAASKGIITGYDGRFNPNADIKREDAAVVIYRIYVLLGKNLRGTKFFGDRREVSAYAKTAVESLGGIGVINGNENGMFMPSDCLTRSEAAQLIFNAFVKAESR